MLAISMIIGTIVYPILALAKIVMNMKFVGVHLTLVHSTRVAKGRETIVLCWGEFISEVDILIHFQSVGKWIVSEGISVILSKSLNLVISNRFEN